jgi:hypothetical protein
LARQRRAENGSDRCIRMKRPINASTGSSTWMSSIEAPVCAASIYAFGQLEPVHLPRHAGVLQESLGAPRNLAGTSSHGLTRHSCADPAPELNPPAPIRHRPPSHRRHLYFYFSPQRRVAGVGRGGFLDPLLGGPPKILPFTGLHRHVESSCQVALSYCLQRGRSRLGASRWRTVCQLTPPNSRLFRWPLHSRG